MKALVGLHSQKHKTPTNPDEVTKMKHTMQSAQ
jgi:hypothetical protein